MGCNPNPAPHNAGSFRNGAPAYCNVGAGYEDACSHVDPDAYCDRDTSPIANGNVNTHAHGDTVACRIDAAGQSNAAGDREYACRQFPSAPAFPYAPCGTA